MAKLLKIGIYIDKWKLDTFENVLTARGYEYMVHPGVTEDTLSIMVMTTDIGLIKSTITEAQKKCEKVRRSKMQ